ncbi:NAD-dependent epimerase/dehydratase family protein [Convivina intestini]|uniref:Nucleoside-diphosphate-sugar epimerase n=1 Tax=Convivina intestini TaxID=1505726 RepID=A0A2U1DFA5_9LACO|nr:NAD(P)-dependent oxidoreductase [Convivina intestini]PVY86366.1 nucleoside-diphosphate-sugar epimerase [Convivina intestini]CAH1850643.1 2-alkyl-3-oxoalkanoate reductase [Convivina intestini]SDB82959.1 Nucleoside-diphosphate-sugar epimerase [Leuconostocaceae bacterium R-53105]
MKKILLTGVTGLLGRQFVADLAQKYEIYGIGRNQTIGQQLVEQYGITFLPMDLAQLSSAQIQTLVDIAPDAIVHGAARSEYWGPKEWFYEANVVGTANMLMVADLAQVKRFIQISSPSVYFHYETAHMITEDYPLPKKFANYYAQTKAEADQLVMANPIPYIIIRPRAIFGPNDETILKPLLDRNAQGGIPLPNYGKSQWIDVTNVSNVVESIRLALETNNPAALNQIYNITDGQPRNMHEILVYLTNRLNVPLKIKPIPFGLLFTAGALDEAIHRMIATRKAPQITRYVASVLGHTQTLSINKAQELLNYQPIKTTNQGIQEFVDAQQS